MGLWAIKMNGLISSENLLKYIERPLNETGIVRRTNGFEIRLNDILIVAVIAIVLLDDEDFIICLIDKNRKEYKFSSLEFTTEAAQKLEEKYDLNFKSLWGSFTYWEHTKGTDRILYPPQLKSKRLYQPSFQSIRAVQNMFKFWLGMKKPDQGVLTEEIEDYIKRHSP